MSILSHCIAFLLGSFIGAAAVYFGNTFTDQRRRQEARSERKREFEEARAKMPKLIAEMKADLEKEGNQLIREFFISRRAFTLNPGGKCFVYYEDDHDNLQSKIHILEDLGYVIDITPRNVPKYRMAKELVEYVLNS